MRRQHFGDTSCAQLQASPAVPPGGQSAGTDTSWSAQTTSASSMQSAALTHLPMCGQPASTAWNMPGRRAMGTHMWPAMQGGRAA